MVQERMWPKDLILRSCIMSRMLCKQPQQIVCNMLATKLSPMRIHQHCKHPCRDGRLAAETVSSRLSYALQELTKSVPSSYELVAQRKGFNRYMTQRLRELVSEHKAALEEREKAAGCILQVTCTKYIASRASFVWVAGCAQEHARPHFNPVSPMQALTRVILGLCAPAPSWASCCGVLPDLCLAALRIAHSISAFT